MDLLLDYTPSARATPGLDHERMVRLLDRYQAYIGHDLPNQLVAIQAYARMLQEHGGAALDPEGRSLLGRLADLTRQADTRARRLAEIGRALRQPEPEQFVALEEAARL